MIAVDELEDEVAEKLERIASQKEDAEAYVALQTATSDEARRAALEVLEPRAYDGELGAALVVAAYYANNDEAKDAKRKAFELYRIGAEQGDDLCQLMVALYYEQGSGVGKDLEQAEAWYRRSADFGNPAAMERLGFLLLEEGEREEALSTLERASEAGRTDATLFLADAAFFGDYGPPDDDEALKYFRRAAEAKSGYGARKLGDFYRKGLGGLEVDLDAAYHWYSLAREYGDDSAYEKLGSMRLLGERGESDPQRALELFEEGADRLDEACMGWLAYLYSSEDWPVYDAEKGYLWSSVVLEIGLEEARPFLERTAADLSEEAAARLRRDAAAIVQKLEQQADSEEVSSE